MASTAGDEGKKGMLDGLRVVEFGGRLAAPLTAMMLADHGAQVVRVASVGGPPGDPVLDAILGRGKIDVSADLGKEEGRSVLARLLAAADVAVTEIDPLELARIGVDFEAVRRGPNPGLISCVIPLFPAGDPRSGLPGYDAVAGAAGCIYERMLGAPRFHDFPVPSVLASLFAASGVVAALYSRLETGRGQQVESTLFGSALFAQILVVFMKTGVPRGFVPLKLVATPFMRAWRCRDGRYAYLHITLPAHNARMIEMLESGGLAEHAAKLRSVLSEQTVRDPSQVGSIGEAKRIVCALERIFLERTADEWEATLGKDLCCIKVRTIEEWIAASMEAGMADAVRVDDPLLGPLVAPGPGVVCEEAPSCAGPRRIATDPPALLDAWEAAAQAARVEHPENKRAPSAASRCPPDPPLKGVRVVDLSRIIAGPCAARLLAELGAEVTSIQSPGGLDWALSFHLLFNPGKRSISIDMSGPDGRESLRNLLSGLSPDVLIQNYRHLEVARSIGVGPESLRREFPDIVYTHLNAYGNKGIWQERPGFEQVVQAVSGIQMSYGTGGKPRLLPTPVIDIGSGLAGAFASLLGLYHRRRTGQGTFVTTHLTWVSVVFQLLHLAAIQRPNQGQPLALPVVGGQGDSHDDRLLGGIARARDGYVVIAGPRSGVERWLHHVGIAHRLAGGGRDPLSALGRSLALRPAAHWRGTVREAGLEAIVAIVPCQKARRLLSDLPHLATGPLPQLSRRTYPGSPMPMAFLTSPLRLDGTPLTFVDPPPMRGADTRDLLARIGVEVPEGTGLVPYPKDRPYLVWLASLIRWGLFAWRSGSV